MKIARSVKAALLVIVGMAIAGCTSKPDSVTPVKGFKLNRYLGTWYEIARYDHSFEEGLKSTVQWYIKNQNWCESVLNESHYLGERIGVKSDKFISQKNK